jgi:hypothetical protein
VLGFGVDVADKHTGRVVKAIRTELDSLAAAGPTAHELAADRRGLVEQLTGGEFARYRAFDEALSALTGLPSSAAHQNEVLAGVAAAAVARAAKESSPPDWCCARRSGTYRPISGTARQPARAGARPPAHARAGRLHRTPGLRARGG